MDNFFTDSEREQARKWVDDVKRYSGARNSSMSNTPRSRFTDNNPFPLKERLIQLYDGGYGFKRLAKSLGLSYTQIRRILMVQCGHATRTGTNVVTDELRKIRKFNVTGEKSPWYDWPKKHPEMLSSHPLSGIQGFYKKSDGNLVWLRSTWEYIYAKWLDAHNQIWSVEDKQFKLSTGESYRPDFFIYEKNGDLIQLVEIKNNYYAVNRKDKYERFLIEYPEYRTRTNLVEDVAPYRQYSYLTEIKKWKQERKLFEGK